MYTITMHLFPHPQESTFPQVFSWWNHTASYFQENDLTPVSDSACTVAPGYSTLPVGCLNPHWIHICFYFPGNIHHPGGIIIQTAPMQGWQIPRLIEIDNWITWSNCSVQTFALNVCTHNNSKKNFYADACTNWVHTCIDGTLCTCTVHT